MPEVLEQTGFWTVDYIADQLVDILKPHMKKRSAQRRVYRAIEDGKLRIQQPEERSKVSYFVPVEDAQAYLNKFRPQCG